MKPSSSILFLVSLAAALLSVTAVQAGVVYTTLDPPGSTNTNIYGIDGNNVVGSYEDSQSVYHGFLYNGSAYTTIDFPGSTNTCALSVSGSNVVGHYTDSTSTSHGFLYDGTTSVALDPPGSTSSYAYAVSGHNVVGWYEDGTGVSHGFFYDGKTYTSLDPSGSMATVATGVSGTNVSGWYEDSAGTSHGFLYNGGVYTTIDPPGTLFTRTTSGSGNSVVGFNSNSDGPQGFLYASGAYTTLAPPGSTAAYAYGVSGNDVVGYYTDGNYLSHGFHFDGKTYTTLDLPSSMGNTVVYPYSSSGNKIVGYYTDGVGTYHGFMAALAAAPATPATFSQWKASYVLPTGATATPFNDGVPNLLKYFHDIDPTRPMTASDRAGLVTAGMVSSGGSSFLTLTYRQNPLTTGMVAQVQISTDLKTWVNDTTDNPQQIRADSTTGDPIMQVQITPLGTGPTFARLNINSP